MRDKITLVLISFLGLFIELCFIRWFPAHVFSIAFFSNIVLIASFLGLGLGLLLSNNRRYFFNVFPYLLAGVVFIVLLLKNAQIELPANARTWIWSYYTGNRFSGLSHLKISITQLVGLIFTLTIMIFIPIGQKIGRLMQGMAPLYAYTLNILGSLLGVVAFAVISYGTRAYMWFLVAGIIVTIVIYKEKRFFIKALVIFSVVIIISLIERHVLWSPYYAINLSVTDDKSINVYVNQLFHQKAVNFEKNSYLYEKYMLPYKWFHPKRVLIIGAGTGNDVWVAQESGAEHINAVEIDPLILTLGKEGHPQRPYDSNKVHVFVDDARSFMSKDSEKYDMIVYGTLDSHATLSITSSIRLDNYVYTKEALRQAQHLLAPEGVVALLFSVPNNWMMTRLLETARSVFGEENTRYVMQDNYLFNLMIVAGSGIKKALLTNPDMDKTLLPLPEKLRIPLPTDNWPYLYLIGHEIPYLYLSTLLILIFISIATIFIFTPMKIKKINPLFFFLGAGFLLLETKSVTTFSLLFGSTWLVNAVVFSSILIIALLANLLIMRRRLENLLWVFIGLISSLVFIYFFPVNALLKFGFFAKIFLAGTLVALPIFFSSFIFAMVIRNVKDIGSALGSNLLGAVLGGFLEYYSMIGGLNALYVIALCCYIAAAIYFMRSKGGVTN